MSALAQESPGVSGRPASLAGLLAPLVGTRSLTVARSPRTDLARPTHRDASMARAGVELVLVDPPESARRRARRYTLHIQPSLLGGDDVLRSWGRIGTMHRPRRLITHHDTEGAALIALRKTVGLRIRRGY